MEIEYRIDRSLTVAEFVDVLHRSTLGERRPVDDQDRIKGMLEHANLLVTAWQHSKLIGVARSLTDFSYCCYLSDLAVDAAFQKQGIGKRLIEETKKVLHPEAKVILLAAPAAREYYPRIGMDAHPSAWVISAKDGLSAKLPEKRVEGMPTDGALT